MRIEILAKLFFLLSFIVLFVLPAQAVTEQQLKDIEERIKPVGQVCVEGNNNCYAAVSVRSNARSGKQVFDAACMACHVYGAGGAPVLGDIAAWADRIAMGNDALYENAINGLPGTGMFAKGACMTCTDEEVAAAVDYIVDNSQ